MAGFEHCVPVLGSVELVDADGQPSALLMLQALVENQGDGWGWTVEQLVRQLEHQRNEAAAAQQTVEGGLLELMTALAKRTAQLHIALAAQHRRPGFRSRAVRRRRHGAVVACAFATRCRRRCEQLTVRAPAAGRAAARSGAPRAGGSRGAADRAHRRGSRHAGVSGIKTRHHGDYHLGQVLIASNDFVIIDFEGEPSRKLEQRRRKHCALRDVAGMLRSFDYARHTALQQVAQSDADAERLPQAARQWEQQARATFIAGLPRYARSPAGCTPTVAAWEAARPLLELFEIEKALYELRYELDNRPDWVGGAAGRAGRADRRCLTAIELKRADMESFTVVVEPVRALLFQIGSYLPRLAVALLVLVAGWLLAKALRFGVVKALRALNFHVLTERAGFDSFLQQGRHREGHDRPVRRASSTGWSSWPR